MKPVAICFALAGALTVSLSAEDAADRHFAERVKPLLESRCISCHGPDKVKGGLRLDSRAAVLKAGDSGQPSVRPGKPAESLLLQAVMHSTRELEMPPKEKLTSNDIAVLERWIRDGAPWPESAAVSSSTPALKPGDRIGDAWHDPRNPIAHLFGGQRLDLWSFQPVASVAPPAVRNRRWPRNAIDQFILARIEAAGLSPTLEADRRSLARRVYFDLTGLPPTPADMDRFLGDRRPDAYERLVDELLASPRYGEHAARAWLDVVRYSDSNGFDWDEFRPRAWRFRDYVIRSFNADKPFDQFIREQLAGDELLDGPARTVEGQDALIATGYLRLGPQDNSAALFSEQPRARAELMADLTETTASAFLGLTISCCRCHDHKFDPLSQADHYRLRAFFEPVKYADDVSLDLEPEQRAIRSHNQSIDRQLKPLQQNRETLLETAKQRLRKERISKLASNETALLEIPAAGLTNGLKAKVQALEKKLEASDKEIKAALSAAEKERQSNLDAEISGLKKKRRDFTLGLLASDGTGTVAVTRILFQGDIKQERDAVAPGFPSALDPNPAKIFPPRNKSTTGRRLTLAEWIASPSNPLTARVLVNRVWQGCFGKGLVATANDFGLAGARPTHPELLDWLAAGFVRDGWSIKKLHRLIVTSAVYRQRSRVGASPDGAAGSTLGDPGDVLYSRQSPRRLSAEELRDSLLAVSGMLTDRSGGPPVWPDLPPEILQANPAFLDDNETKTKGWYPSPKKEQTVRSIYLVQKKTVRVPFMETFDLPENSISCPCRSASIVAPQALSLLNSPLALETAKAFAARVRTEAGSSPDAQVRRAFSLALQRKPAREESDACLHLLKTRPLAELCRALLNLNEFVYLD
ncbi:MAG: hypothetical protein QOF48_1593 [Verrucomicrobiota bacterium]